MKVKSRICHSCIHGLALKLCQLCTCALWAVMLLGSAPYGLALTLLWQALDAPPSPPPCPTPLPPGSGCSPGVDPLRLGGRGSGSGPCPGSGPD